MSAPTPSAVAATAISAVPRIFVSHSHQDNAFGVRLVTALRTALGGDENTAWFDISGGAHGGDTLWRKIVQEITDRPIFIVVASPQSLASPWVMNEINIAWTLKNTRPNRHIIPVLYEACDLPADLLMQLYVSFLPPQPFETGLASLVTAIHALSGTRPTLAPAVPPDVVGASGGRPPTATTPSPTPVGALPAAPAAPAPADPQAALLARQLAAMRDAAAQHNWHLVLDTADYLLARVPAERIPTEVYRLVGEARAAVGDDAAARTALEAALARDDGDTAVLALAGRVCLRLHDPTAAARHLKDALGLVTNPAQQAERLALLRDYAAALIELKQWDELLRRADEGSHLASDDGYWPRLRLGALMELHRDADALALLRTLTDRPDATARDWLARARLVRAVEGETESADAEARAALEAAARLAGPNDAAVAAARRELFPPPAPPAPPIAPEYFPDRLASLGFVPRKGKDSQTGTEAAFILPPTVPVAAGQFQMGKTNPRDPDAKYDGPARTASTAAYAIARYPVTVAEYACFVRAGQQEPPQGVLGVDWRTQLTRLDHPVTCVSWHAATAYAEWLARLSGQSWRLPTEEEWEKAARWDPRSGASHLYPWGDTFDKARCNTSESGIRTTTPVGKYGASGASPVGAEDMAGNVWEWTSSPYGSSTDNRLVLRGGSWVNGRQGARAACRDLDVPDLVGDCIGFRVVLAAPGS